MEVWLNNTMWLIILIGLCLLLIWLRWRLTHPRCPSCKKHIRRVYPYCPWCSLKQFHAHHANTGYKMPAYRRASLAAPKTMPHKRARTIILPEHASDQRYETVLVPDPLLQRTNRRWRKQQQRSRTVPVQPQICTCAKCGTVLHEDDKRCWWCNSKFIVYGEKYQ